MGDRTDDEHSPSGSVIRSHHQTLEPTPAGCKSLTALRQAGFKSRKARLELADHPAQFGQTP